MAALLYQSTIGAALPQNSPQKPPYFVLAGDSTVTPGAGWGDGFGSFVKSPSDTLNLALGGTTTHTFRARGLWSQALEAVAANATDFQPIVTIQFGHNDQKPEAHLTLEQFQANLERMCNEVTEAGGTPIIITSLTRRAFENGKVIENLSEHSAAALRAAEAVGATALDLNLASTDYINAIGQENADFYNYAPGDRTHLDANGSIVFGRLVIDLLLDKRKDLGCYFEANEVLSEKLRKGEFATGDE